MPQSFSLTSPAFEADSELNPKYTCEGIDISPPLSWSGAPKGTKSFALIVDDPDAPDPQAPQTDWVHWVLYNIPPEVDHLEEGISQFPKGTLLGSNDWEENSYGGPCPPVGRHRYFFKLYALDLVLPNLHFPNKQKLEQAMKGHVLGQATLMATYQKKAVASKVRTDQHFTSP